MISNIASWAAWFLLMSALYYHLQHQEVNSGNAQMLIYDITNSTTNDAKARPLIFLSISAFVLFVLHLVKKADPSIFNSPLPKEKGSMANSHAIVIELISMIQLWIGGLALLLCKKTSSEDFQAMHSLWFYISLLVFIVLIYILRMHKHQKS